MKTIFSIVAVFGFAAVSAQVDPQPQTKPILKDTTTTNQQLQKQSDLKTMDAVKTQDHPKLSKAPQRDVKKDTIHKKSTRRK